MGHPISPRSAWPGCNFSISEEPIPMLRSVPVASRECFFYYVPFFWLGGLSGCVGVVFFFFRASNHIHTNAHIQSKCV